MIDELMCRQADRAGYAVDPNYSPDSVVRGVQVYNPGAERLSVIFPPWHGGGKYTQKLAERVAAHRDPDGADSAVWLYDFADEIIQPDVDGVLKGYKNVRDTVAQSLDESVGDGKRYSSVDFYSISLGTVAASVVAGAFPNFRAATMAVPGSSLAKCLWDGSRTQAIRERLELRNEGLTKDDLHDAWQELTTKHNISSFAGKSALIISSCTDRIIPYEYQREVMAQLSAAQARVHFPKPTLLGHYATSANFCQRGPVGQL